jgi:DeoR/GlpR family transcriptional regulator of sugar metabolism
MLKRERQAYILNQVTLHNKLLCNTLSTQIQVSEDSFRELQGQLEKGEWTKVQGGSRSPALFTSPIIKKKYPKDICK